MAQSDSETIRSVEIACTVIATLQELDGGGITEISNRTGHSKSTIYDHLRTLEANQLVVKEDDQYRLSVRFLDVASHVRDQFGNYDVIRDELDKAAEETGEIVQFGMEEHKKVGYLYKAQGDRAVQTISSVGTYQPMHSTALGKALLAQFSDERVHKILDRQGMERRTENTITDREELFEELADVRDRGYAIDDQENIRGLRCISVPVGSDDTILGAVSVSGPSSRFNQDRLHEELPKLMKNTANVIELNTKYS
ncbi:IclR family transcriptional regulator [Halorubrum sp. CBA1229]|uniref:IclR family transcriptional regulator n=1 Tax=Halorubrum sp. CBA1229 TaxID=1853699 RepID=UPI000F40A254|nr:IclR family transcriptional regulator [Halorubrum sp. CBA1229]QKY18677.1 IclR family transcriptional regulator [Halorubrum sp. CBA1229]